MTDARVYGVVAEVMGTPAAVEARVYGVASEALGTTPPAATRVYGVLAEVLGVRGPTEALVYGLAAEVMGTAARGIVTVGAPGVPVQIKWPDGTWHALAHPPPPVPFDPTAVAGLTLWVDATQQAGSDGARVTTVTDFSPAHRTLGLPAGNEPFYRADFGGKPCLEWMSAVYGGMDCGTWNPGPVGLTFLFVGQITGGSYPMMVVWGPDADGFEMRHGGSSLQIVLRYSSHGIVWSHPTPSSGGQRYLWAMRVDPVDSDAWTNTVQASGARPAMPDIPQSLYVGRRQGGYPFVGPMCEVLAYAGPVSDADMTRLFDYLMAKWTL